nr:dolichyl-phosphate beta-glucosyltransferase [Quercus suber]
MPHRNLVDMVQRHLIKRTPHGLATPAVWRTPIAESFCWAVFLTLVEAGCFMRRGALPGDNFTTLWDHDNCGIHFDLKPNNDWGFSAMAKSPFYQNPRDFKGRGTPGCRAPEHREISTRELPVGSPANVWCIGRIILCMMSLDVSAFGEIRSIEDYPSVRQNYSTTLVDLVGNCLNHAPEERIEITELFGCVNGHVGNDGPDGTALINRRKEVKDIVRWSPTKLTTTKTTVAWLSCVTPGNCVAGKLHRLIISFAMDSTDSIPQSAWSLLDILAAVPLWTWAVIAVTGLFGIIVLSYLGLYLLAPTPRAPRPSEKQYTTISADGLLSRPQTLPCWYDNFVVLQEMARNGKISYDEAHQITDAECFMSLVVPAYNEENRLGIMLEEAVEYLQVQYGHHGTKSKSSSDAKLQANGLQSDPRRGWEIIIVSDGSTDKTVETALKFAARYPLGNHSGGSRSFSISPGTIRVVELEQNRGKGGAVTHGMRHARGTYVVFADADGASRFSDLGALVVGCERTKDKYGRAVGVGSRAHMVGTEAVVKRSALRNLLMRGFHLLIWTLTTPRTSTIRDTQCGFKLFSRPSLPYIIPYMHSEGWIFDVEMLMLAEAANIPMVEVPIGWKEVSTDETELCDQEKSTERGKLVAIKTAVFVLIQHTSEYCEAVSIQPAEALFKTKLTHTSGPARTLSLHCEQIAVGQAHVQLRLTSCTSPLLYFYSSTLPASVLSTCIEEPQIWPLLLQQTSSLQCRWTARDPPRSSLIRFREMFRNVVQVDVGEAGKQSSFPLHRGVLAFYSGYFESALKDSFQEGKTGNIKLETEDVVVFNQFVGWLYTRRIAYVSALNSSSRYMEIFKLWIFADRREIPLLMNMVIDDFRTCFMKVLVAAHSKSLQYLYDNTTATSQLRTFVGFLTCSTNDFQYMGDEAHKNTSWPMEVLRDYLVLVGKMRTENRTWPMTKAEIGNTDTCKYHVHEQGVKCEKKK